MTQAVRQAVGVDRYANEFATRAQSRPGRDLRWLETLRQAGFDQFRAAGFPTTRNEAWRYTNVAPLTRTLFHLDDRREAIEASHAVLPTIGPLKTTASTEIVFVNGVCMPRHSRVGALPEGVRVTTIERALESEPALVERYLGQHLDIRDHAFAALNTAFIGDGAFIHVPRGAALETPIHLTFLSSREDEPFVAHPRILVIAEPGSQLTLVEHYVGGDQGIYFNNVVTEIHAAQGAVVDHYKIQQEGREAFHIANTHVHQARDSAVSSHSIALGAGLARHEVTSVLDGEGADCMLNGLYMLDGDQHSDHHTFIDHAKPHVQSRQLFKGIMDGSSRGVFTGKVVVRQDAQKINADQSNKNLLLSDKSLAESRPQLEIYADDVRCTHGSAIGHLDDDMIFYLRSRGIGADDARNLLVYAFASEILGGFKVKQIRSMLEEIFAEWLPAGRLLGGKDDGIPQDC